jgi:GDPmannose 4,6-dehydratase
LATGETHSVREFVELAFAEVGMTIAWRGKGADEQGVCTRTNRILVRVDPDYFRPTEVDLLIGNPAKARQKLGWCSTTTLQEMVAEMVAHDLSATEGQLTATSAMATRSSAARTTGGRPKSIQATSSPSSTKHSSREALAEEMSHG